MDRPVWMSAALATAALAIVGCAAPFDFFRSPDLKDAEPVVQDYLSNLRWGRFDDAAELVHPDRRRAFRRLVAGREDQLRITSFEVESIEPVDEEGLARATIRYRVYRLPSLTDEGRRETIGLRWERPQNRWFVQPNLASLERDLSGPSVGSSP